MNNNTTNTIFVVAFLVAIAGTNGSAFAVAAKSLGPETAAVDIKEVEEVLVVGRRPGPPLWRITNGDNTLWIFSTLSPFPKDLSWDSDALKHIIGEASHFIPAPKISASTSNPLKLLKVIRQLKNAETLPGNTRLQDLADPANWLTFAQLCESYGIRMNSLNRLRPMAAGDRLTEKVYARNRLEDTEPLTAKLNKLAKRGKLSILDTTAEVSLKDVLDVIRNVPISAELSCLQSTLEHIAYDQWAAVDRARAWANGNASHLLALDYPAPDEVCSTAIAQTKIGREARGLSRSLWLAHAQEALESHKTTLTTLPMAEIARPDGLVANLLSHGYARRGQQSPGTRGDGSQFITPATRQLP